MSSTSKVTPLSGSPFSTIADTPDETNSEEIDDPNGTLRNFKIEAQGTPEREESRKKSSSKSSSLKGIKISKKRGK